MISGVVVHRSNRGVEAIGRGPVWQSRWSFGPRRPNHSAVILAALTAALAGAWLALVFLVEPARFVIFDPHAGTGFEVFLAIGQIFGAFVLAISPVQAARGRLRWVAAGLLVFGIGAIGYGYIYPSLVASPSLAVTMYGSIYARTVATVLCAIGFAAPRVPNLSWRGLTGLATVIALIGLLLARFADRLPELIRAAGEFAGAHLESVPTGRGSQDPLQLTDLEVMLSTTGAIFPGLTAWHFGLAMLPLAASAIAAWHAARRAACQAGGIGLWLVLAFTLLAGAQLHSVFWPSMYSSVFSATSLLRLTAVAVVIVGGIVELRTVIHQRDALLMAEQERVQRLEDLARLKADFTSIIAHELANPIAAIKVMSQVVAVDDLPAEVRRRTAGEIEGEVRLLEMLVEDIRETARAERDDFRITPRRLPVDRLIEEAAAYARGLPGDHPLSIEHTATATVYGDPHRLGQVIRNLLSNAARYTPDGTLIIIRTCREDGEVVIEVADQGPGIPPEDLERIFEKFGRGRDAVQSHAGGRGLGLYLSRRIMRSHQSNLIVESEPGRGTSFSFRLKELS